jgi:hypothetical protein
MNNETMELLKTANKDLGVAYKNIRICISDFGKEDSERLKLRQALMDVDSAALILEDMLGISTKDVYEFVQEGQVTVYRKVNHE